MNEKEVTTMVADTLRWAGRQSSLPGIVNIENATETTLLFDTLDGSTFMIEFIQIGDE